MKNAYFNTVFTKKLFMLCSLNYVVVFRMEFDKTRWSCLWNSDQNYTQKCQGVVGVKEVGGCGVKGVGVVGVKAVGVVG